MGKRKRYGVWGGLLLLSTLYDVLVIRRMDRLPGMMEKWTWATVVFGVAYTLSGVWLIDRKAAKLVFLCFCFSGLPMSVGDLVRWYERKRNGDRVVAAVRKRSYLDDYNKK